MTEHCSHVLSAGSAHYRRPGRFVRGVLNPLVAWLTRRGVNVWGSRVLQVRGRRSGQWRSTPVNVLELDGRCYLVAARGRTDWVRNLEAAGQGRLQLGRRTWTFTATPVPADDGAEVLRAYLRRWAWEVGAFFDGVGADSTHEELQRGGRSAPRVRHRGRRRRGLSPRRWSGRLASVRDERGAAVAEVTETQLPGVGVRYEFRTSDRDHVGVVHHHSGRREIVIYDRKDPDVARSVMELDADDSRTLSDLLGASQVTEALEVAQQRIEGLTLEWIEVDEESSMANHSIGDGQLRTRTGASVVAVIRGSSSEPAPSPDYVLEPGDVVVAVGTAEGLELLRRALRP